SPRRVSPVGTSWAETLSADALSHDGRHGRVEANGRRTGHAGSRLPRIVATDLDGTLVRSDHTVSGYSHEVLRNVRDAGLEVVGVTGRGPRLRTLTAAHVAVARYLVCAQGA